jgi:transcriptional regulator with XRE-family HTH domain
LTVQDLLRIPVHGPYGRIATVRSLLELRQTDLASELKARGGRASRETVSHWENFDATGQPRARMTLRNAAALAALVRDRLVLTEAAEDLFFEPRETAWDAVARRQIEISEQLSQLVTAVQALHARLAPSNSL